ncbi:MAG: 3-keto-disaccharide hydrolase [Akkermansiaceae bacterium]
MIKQLFVSLSLMAPILSTAADDSLCLSHFEDKKGWSMVESAQINPDKQTTLIIQEGDAKTLSNGSAKNTASYIKTKKQYGDHTIHAEFMIPKGSNSGFYVMGCYEIQIFDSFGKDEIDSSDIGSLYQRWSNKRPKNSRGYEGVTAKTNAAKPAGEWQSLMIKFKAPRFDINGNKTENAKFILVTINDQITLENTEAKGPTRSHPVKKEAAQGPLSIQGDHGPIAIRKLQILEEDFSNE